MSNNVEKMIVMGISPIVEGLGYELVDVEFRKSNAEKFITIYIFKEGGLMLEDCEIVHRAIDEPLDAINPTGEEPYTLSVSSPGLDRPLIKDRDYERNIGEEVEAIYTRPINGVTNVCGILLSFDDDNIELEIKNNAKMYNRKSIAMVRPYVRF